MLVCLFVWGSQSCRKNITRRSDKRERKKSVERGHVLCLYLAVVVIVVYLCLCAG